MTEQELAIPSNRIRFAVEAMREFEARPNCQIHMGEWRRIHGGVCYACCGGAAHLKLKGIVPDTNDESWTLCGISAFEESLNEARFGEIGCMFELMDLPYDSGNAINREITPHSVDPSQFYADMETLADDLQAAGY